MIRMTALTNLHHDDGVTLFPSLASLQPDGQAWRVAVSGIVFRDGQLTLGKKLILGILRRAMRASREEFESELFRDIGRATCQGMIDLAAGRTPLGIVNPEVLERPGFLRKCSAWRPS